MLLHGLGLDHRMWERQVPALAAAGYRVVTADLLGHGRSDRPSRPGSSYTVADLADSLVRTLEEADVGRATLAGFSLGGGVALQIALARPDRVGALALADTSAWMGPGASALFTERAAAVEARGVEVLVQPAIARWFTPEFVATHGDAVARYAARIGENDAYGYAAACRSLATFDVRERLGALRCPTLVVVGDRDQATPVAMAETLANGIPGAELRILGPSGHLLTEERWEAFNEVLLAFLSRADVTSPRTT